VYKFLLFVVMLGVQVFSLSAQGNIKSSEPSVARQNTPKSAITNVVDRAHTLIGTPYRWGGSTLTEGFDCSGLLVYLFLNEARIKLPRTTTAMQRSSAKNVARKALKPGDAVFFNGNGRGRINHVGLYIGGGKFIHAPRSGKGVRIDSLANAYWKKNFTLAKRFHSEA